MGLCSKIPLFNFWSLFMMKKTLVAVAALAATGAFAQSVTLTGRAHVEYSTWGATGSVNPTNDLAARSRLADNGSRITFAVNEDLGGGMNAGVYCETGIQFDQANNLGQNNVAPSTTKSPSVSEWCSREGRLVIGNKTAELRLGRQNVWWGQGELNDTGSNKVGIDVSSNVFLVHGAGGNYTRVDNTIKVVAGSDLGTFAGSEVWTAIVSGNEAASNGVDPTSKGKNLMGFTLKYAFNPEIVSQIDYLSATGTASSSGVSSFDRSMVRFGLGYKYSPGSIVSGQYWTNERTDLSGVANTFANAGNTSSAATGITGTVKGTGYIFNLNHNFGGNFTAVAQYTRANNIQVGSSATELGDSGVNAYTLGGMYRLSKRTHIFGALNSIQNGYWANASTGGGGQASGTVANGATVSVTSIGLQHNF